MDDIDQKDDHEFDFEKPIDKTKLKYALYLRKSSEDEGHQTHSIDDQKRNCLEYAYRLGISIKDPDDIYSEDKSARYPNNRPIFTKLIKKVEVGEYNGIIAYHPDRLARNMLEAGQILNMLKPAKGAQESVLKDLVFPTVAYHNDSGGRLLLSVLFSMATQYSEHLQEVVKRGVRSHHREGKSSGSHKWGYKRNAQGLYVPDDTWEDIRKGWEMILAGKKESDVLAFWEARDVHSWTKETEKKPSRKISITRKSKTIASRHFHDPFAFGILYQAKKEVDLRVIQPEFKPLVTEEEFNQVQALLPKNHRTSRKRPKGNDTFLPFRHMVHCKCCGGAMYPAPVKNHSNAQFRRLYYYCQNKDCPRRKDKSIPSGIRGQDLLDQIYLILDGMRLSSKSYNEYSSTIDETSDLEIDRLRKEKRSLLGQKSSLIKKRDEKSDQYTALVANKKTPEIVLTRCNKAIEDLQTQIIELDEDIKEVVSKIRDPKQIKATKDEFLNLAQNIGKQMRKAKKVEKDIIARKVFLNLIVDEQNKLSVICKPDLEGLVDFEESDKVAFGGDMWT